MVEAFTWIRRDHLVVASLVGVVAVDVELVQQAAFLQGVEEGAVSEGSRVVAWAVGTSFYKQEPPLCVDYCLTIN